MKVLNKSKCWKYVFMTALLFFVCQYVVADNDNNKSGGDDDTGEKDKTTDPIGITGGDVYLDEVDVVIPCPLINIHFQRSYSSGWDYSGPLGRRWTHSYDWKLEFEEEEGDIQAHKLPRDIVRLNAVANPGAGMYSGSTLKFEVLEDGTYKALGLNNYFMETNGVGYKVRNGAGISYLFDSSGVVTNIAHDAGPNLTLAYTNSKLSRVEHSNGQYLDFSYSGANISSVTTPSTNLSVTFGYNSDNALIISVRNTSRGSFTNAYTYQQDQDGIEHARLTKRVNPNGETFVYEYEGADGYDARGKGMHVEPGNYYKVRLEHRPPQEIMEPARMTIVVK